MGKKVWYSHLFKNFPQFVVIHTVKGFSIVNEAEIDVFLELSCFYYDPMDVGNLISGSVTFLNPACTSDGKNTDHFFFFSNLKELFWDDLLGFFENLAYEILLGALIFSW